MRTALALSLALLCLASCQSDKHKSRIFHNQQENSTSALFTMVDADGDGAVTREEFAARYAPLTFLYFDRNGDGIITPAEWALDGQTPERLQWFRSLDQDGDGAVSRDEFFAASSPEFVDEFFGLMDKNGDGRITRKEVGID